MSRIQGKTVSPQFATAQVYVGVDVSKLRLDVYLHPIGLSQSVTNDKMSNVSTYRTDLGV